MTPPKLKGQLSLVVLLVCVYPMGPDAIKNLAGNSKVAKRWDCFLGMGFRAGGCGGGSDLRIHERRLMNLENAGHKNHIYTKRVGRRVTALKEVAEKHQKVHESLIFKSSISRDKLTEELSSAGDLLRNFPSAAKERDEASRAWKRAFTERILRPITVWDYLLIGVVSLVALIVGVKVILCARSRAKMLRNRGNGVTNVTISSGLVSRSESRFQSQASVV